MKLHKYDAEFGNAIEKTSKYFRIGPSLIEKDYFVTLVLEEINKRVPGLLFKGGTSLSKCFKIIDRFSEDIDLTLDNEHFTIGQRRKVKYTIIDICDELGLSLLNVDETRSRREYNNYVINYPIKYSSKYLTQYLRVEMVFIQKAYPSEIKKVDSIIGEYLRATNNVEIIDKYEMYPFDIQVQSLERTLIDKVFAICDYMERNITSGNSRHIYDIYKILPKVKLDENLKELVNEVRKDRKVNKNCISAQDGISVTSILRKIIDTQYFKKDYEENTENLLSKYVDYEDAIRGIEKIIESDIF